MVEGMLSDGSEAYKSCCVGKKMGCYEKREARKELDMRVMGLFEGTVNMICSVYSEKDGEVPIIFNSLVRELL